MYPLSSYKIALIALFIVPLSGVSIDIYVPSLPALANYFQVDRSFSQLTISSYLLGFGCSQLLIGSIIDSLGRRKPLLIALSIYCLTSLTITFSPNIYLLIALRMVQGLAIGCTGVSARSMIADLFSGKEFYKMASYMTIAWAIGPIIAPAIGGYLQHYFGWQSPFYFLTCYSGIMFGLFLFFVPETLSTKGHLNLSYVASSYKQILSSGEYWIGLICLGCMYSMLVLFNVVGPFLLQKVIHLSAIEFGQVALLMGLAWFLGNLTNRVLINFSFTHKVRLPLYLMLIDTIFMLIIAYHWINLYAIVIPTFFLLYLASIVFPNYFARNMIIFPKLIGTSSAISGAFMTLIAAIYGSGIGILLKTNTQIPLSYGFLVLVLICYIMYQLQQRYLKVEQ